LMPLITTQKSTTPGFLIQETIRITFEELHLPPSFGQQIQCFKIHIHELS
jgi:hypothetical protein